MNVNVISDGAWATALARLLAANGHKVTLWSPFPDYARILRSCRENVKFLPGFGIPDSITIVSTDSGPRPPADLIISTHPAQYLRQILVTVKSQLPPSPVIVSGTKGIENGSLMRPTEIIREVLAPARLAVISGPSHAEEVARELPTTVVAASDDVAFTRLVQDALTSARFRVYTSSDAVGVELAGALKNVIAIAAGICEGLGFGDNSKAALITRGMVEIARLGKAMGARPATFAGLAGIGDLITTCYSPYGRNRAVGLAIGKGKKLDRVLADMGMVVAEGVATTKSVIALGQRFQVEMPITEQMHAILFDNTDPRDAVTNLMTRQPKAESEL
jgi:glycerol-3-phosphate dehydrogenase (NAD(P)+)